MLDQEVDDKGTDQETAQHILAALRDQGFDSDNEKFAKALGRTIEQVDGMIKGAETIAGTEICSTCQQSYAYQTGVYCLDCDGNVCPLCVRESETGEARCSGCCDG